MIVFNGIELDLYKGSLKPPIIKKSLASLQNLEDRKGTVSTEFNIPRTPKNELAFNNASVAGSNTTAIGEAIIYVDGNIYEQGTLYLRGFNDNDFNCLFIGGEMDFLGSIRTLPLSDLFFNIANNDYNLTDKSLTTVRTASGLRYINYSYSPNLNGQGTLTGSIEERGTAINVRDLVNKIVTNQGYTLGGNFFSYYADGLYYSSFEGDKFNYNFFGGNTYTINNSNVNDSLSFSAVGGTNTSVVSISNPIGSGDAVKLTRESEILKIRLNITDNSQFALNGLFSNFIIEVRSLNGVTLKERRIGNIYYGVNYIDVEIARSTGNFLVDDIILFYIDPYDTSANQQYIIGNFLVQMDIDIDDKYNPFDSFENILQLDWLKKVLVKFNLLLTIEGNSVVIDCAENFEVRNSNGTLVDFGNGIVSGLLDITNDVEYSTNVDIDYVQNKAFYFTEKHFDEVYANSFGFFQFQQLGSYYKLTNAFNKTEILSKESEFTSGITSVNQTQWSNALFIKSDALIDTSVFGFNYKNVWENFVKPTFFSRTLSEKENDKIKSILIFDHLGTKINFRTDYIIENQVYKLVSYEYNLETKLVNAKMILKNG
jgi:hypothetical protein